MTQQTLKSKISFKTKDNENLCFIVESKLENNSLKLTFFQKDNKNTWTKTFVMENQFEPILECFLLSTAKEKGNLKTYTVSYVFTEEKESSDGPKSFFDKPSMNCNMVIIMNEKGWPNPFKIWCHYQDKDDLLKKIPKKTKYETVIEYEEQYSSLLHKKMNEIRTFLISHGVSIPILEDKREMKHKRFIFKNEQGLGDYDIFFSKDNVYIIKLEPLKKGKGSARKECFKFEKSNLQPKKVFTFVEKNPNIISFFNSESVAYWFTNSEISPKVKLVVEDYTKNMEKNPQGKNLVIEMKIKIGSSTSIGYFPFPFVDDENEIEKIYLEYDGLLDKIEQEIKNQHALESMKNVYDKLYQELENLNTKK